MKATGVIRRIDELGRIVIPKEIRKNLRIREGDSLEIYIGEDETILLRKHSALKKLSELAVLMADSIYSDLKRNIVISDTDRVLAAAGKNKKEYLGKEISSKIVESIGRRERMLEKHSKDFTICDVTEEMTYTISTIITGGDAVGTVIIFDKQVPVGEVEEKVAYVVSNFLAKHIDE